MEDRHWFWPLLGVVGIIASMVAWFNGDQLAAIYMIALAIAVMQR